MEKSVNCESELSEDLSDVSFQAENTIDDSLLTSEEDTSYNKKNYKHEIPFEKKKSLVVDSTDDLDETSVLGESESEINSEVVENSYLSDDEKGNVQQSSKGSSVQITKKISMDPDVDDYSDSDEEGKGQQSSKGSFVQITKKKVSLDPDASDDSDSNYEEICTRPSGNKNRIISTDSSDTEAVTPQRNNKSKPKISTMIHSDSSYDDKTVDLGLDKVVANISLELSKSRISKRESDSPHIIETESSESDGALKSIRPNLRLSEDFGSFGKGKNILHSTLLEPQGPVTPVNKVTGKRLLNKSIETPRMIKQIKESYTPRNVPQIVSDSSGSDVYHNSDDEEDIIDVSSDEEVPSKTPVRNIMKQTTLDALVVKAKPPIMVDIKKEQNNSQILEVSPAEYQMQEYKIKGVETDLHKARNLIKVVNLEHLPDKGKSIRLRQQSLESQLLEEVKKLSKMKVTKENTQASTSSTNAQSKVKILSWEEMEAKATVVQPRTFGKQAMSTYNAQKAVTMDRLQQLHGSLKTCPGENDVADDPKGLKVDLMPHQRRALVWLMWREMQKPSGGILADDMGLGKTLTMIALMLKTKEAEEDTGDSSDEENSPPSKQKFNGGTLVVCPASLINQWSGELEKRTKRGLASYEMYHGPKRETKPKKLAQHDMVITTYSIVNNECEKNGAVFRVKWRRIVIDEAHQIRNHKSQTSDAVCKLAAKSRWALTGTPVHNKELDMYALMKFIRCTPFDDLAVWKRWVGDKSTGGTERLHTVISSLMLRRTKVELIEKGFLNAMPARKWELIEVDLTKAERDVYSKILLFSRTLFAQFLHQRAEKNQDAYLVHCDNLNQLPNGQNQEYVKMRQKLLRLNKLKDIKQHEILVLLLRLRQICCHPSLITGMLHNDMDILGEDDDGDKSEAMDLLEQLNKLTLEGDEHHPEQDEHRPIANVAEGIGEEALGLKEAARGVLNPADPIFCGTTMSSKIKELIKVLKENVLEKDDKAIIVSQWSSFLRLISHHLKEKRINFDQLDGTVPVHKRMDMVDRLNNPKDRMKVLLLSLTAGGVGLNLVGANHLFLLDLHWNPQLENQAQDRIYRLGQQKEVNVYKFMATDTIEKRILDLQEKKLEIAKSMLTGTKQVMTSKLSLQDLKMLFEM